MHIVVLQQRVHAPILARTVTLAGLFSPRNRSVAGVGEAHGDANSGSDVDLLVELESGRSRFDLGGLLTDLRSLLESLSDVVTPAALQERVRTKVLREAVPL
ncbi:MAG: nucleotidyltransferase family protein [Gammaproteobacteria bacterium]